ncbi:hypothetical protein [Rhabdochromatium marinum]|uniref:hypothetical protein n=1 Tax=Rhabdochromatium marinum TaxID=48729 RepID=UPI001905D4D2|nr:hypothetical protein [Rhabdochromatium marinum]MBK1647124.1 hypothetical protein [Rhabdochromatium marinum]
MLFFFRRYRYAIIAHKAWLLLIIVISFCVGGWFAARPDLSIVYQSFSVAGDPLIAASDSPVNVLPLSRLIDQPTEFFSERFATTQLREELSLAGLLPDNIQSNDFGLGRLARDTMTLERTSSGKVRVRYKGNNEKVGVALVKFFSKRLAERARSGKTRAAGQMAISGTPNAGSPISVQPILTPDQSIIIDTARSPFHIAKLVPALLTFAILMVVFLLAVGIKEFLNAAFKSERQMAQYLGLRVLGTMIDADRLSTARQSST